MRGKRVLFCDRDAQVRRLAERALSATGSAVDLAEDLRALDLAQAVASHDLLMIACEPADLADPGWLALLQQLDEQSGDVPVVLHTTGKPEEYIPLMLERPSLRNLIAKNDEMLDADELIITAEKLLRRDIFGLEKYLLWGVEPMRVAIRASTEKRDYLACVSDYAASLGCKERALIMIENVADELITNAIFNAPRGPDGTARYATQCRREPVVLEDHEVGELQIASDGHYLAIAQTDPFGALTPDTVISYLNRGLTRGPDQITHVTGGAGIGLFRIFQSLSKFIINIEPGCRTEVISLVDLRMSMKRFRLASKSFHIFVSRPGHAHVRSSLAHVGKGA